MILIHAHEETFLAVDTCTWWSMSEGTKPYLRFLFDQYPQLSFSCWSEHFSEIIEDEAPFYVRLKHIDADGNENDSDDLCQADRIFNFGKSVFVISDGGDSYYTLENFKNNEIPNTYTEVGQKEILEFINK